MTGNSGMFGDLFTPVSDREREEEQMHQFQAADPFRAMAHASYTGGTLAGKGLGRATAALAGADVRDPRAVVRAAVAGLEPGSDQYFGVLVKTLGELGLVEQAATAQKAWDQAKLTRAHAGYYDRGNRPESKAPAPLKGKDFLLAKYDDIAAKLAENPEDVKLQSALKNVQTTLKTFYPDKPEPKRGFQIVPPTATSPGYKINLDTGEESQLEGRIAPPEKGLTPAQQAKIDDAKEKMAAGYESAFVKTQSDYDAAVRLYNHPKLPEALGAFNSAMSDQSPAERTIWTRFLMWGKTDEGRNAVALIQTVKAGAFLNGFQEIKQASAAAGAQGAGFGALSDAEGARIQAAKGALDAAQGAPQFRRELKKYIEQMVKSWNAISGGVTKITGVPPKAIAEKPLTGGARRTAEPASTAPTLPPTPAPAPAAPSAAPANGGEVWERGPDGKLRRAQ